MKVIIASGVGKLHFHETVRAVASAGVDVDFVTGWVPRPGMDAFVNSLGTLLGERGLAGRMRARAIEAPRVTVRSLAGAEFFARSVGYLSRIGLFKATTTGGWAFQITGCASRRYLHNGTVFQVRSGAGQGGAISTAHSNGMKVIADHSIAHPGYMRTVLQEEYARADISYELSLDKGLWRVVLNDCEQADRLLVNSDFVKGTFVERGYSPDRIDVEYLGVSPRYFYLKKDYDRVGPLKVLFTGNFDLRKGARVMLEAIRQVRRGGIDVRLHIIGNMTNGQRWITESDSQFLTHTPFVPPEAVLPALADADIFVFPTLIEGCSRSAMEAAAAGLPVITTKNCGLPLVDRESALYVRLNDLESLADTIAQAATDQALRESIGRAAADKISQNYTWPDYGRKLLQVYERVLS